MKQYTTEEMKRIKDGIVPNGRSINAVRAFACRHGIAFHNDPKRRFSLRIGIVARRFGLKIVASKVKM